MSGEEQKNECTATIAANGRVDRNVRRPRVQQFERTDDSFLGRYKQHDIRIDRESGKNWYIAVQAPSGLYAYDGYWLNSQWKSMDDAISEACTGAQLWTPKASFRGGPEARPAGNDS